MVQDERLGSRKTLEAIIDSAVDAVITANSQGEIVTWNPAAKGLFGYVSAEIIGEKLSVLVPERFRTAHEAGLSRVVETGETKIIGHSVDVFGLHRTGASSPSSCPCRHGSRTVNDSSAALSATHRSGRR